MVFNPTFNNISVILWDSVLYEEFGVPGENHRLVASHKDTLSVPRLPHLSGLMVLNQSIFE